MFGGIGNSTKINYNERKERELFWRSSDENIRERREQAAPPFIDKRSSKGRLEVGHRIRQMVIVGGINNR